MSGATSTHFINSCFPIGNIGGQDSVMSREATLNPDKQVVCIAPDTDPGKYGNIEYRRADELQPGQQDRWDLWFGVGLCQLTFPEAYTTPSAQLDAVEAMLAADKDRPSEHPIGSLERLLEYVQEHAPDWSAARHFTQRFENQILDMPAGSIMNWQSFFMEPAINDYAAALRKNGVIQTFHLHESLPDSLHLSTWGRSFLDAMGKVDVIYLHTDEFIRRLEKQLEVGRAAGWIQSDRLPEIKRFDLGIDERMIRDGLATISAGNYLSAIPNWHELNHGQKDFIREVFQSQDTVPHRFMCVDRIDPVKGVDVVLKGVDAFLQERLAGGATYHELRDNYRFFFLQKAGNATDSNPYNTAARYNTFTEEAFQQLQQKYPGIIFRGDPLGGAHRMAVFPLMRGCHGITGGTTEGLSLSIMENAKVNEGQDTSIICGTGAGFSMQVREHHNQHLAQFPQAGNPADFQQAIRSIVEVQHHSKGTLGSNKKALIQQEIDSRQSSVIADPAQDSL